MRDAIGQILLFGVAVGLSPLPIIAVVLMLATPRARSNGPAFLVGWIVGLAIVGTIVMLATSGASASDDGEPATWVGIVKLALGLLLFALGIKQWRGRPKHGQTPDPPKWMKSVDHFTPPKALAMGAVLSGVNPKNLLMTVAAAAAIAETGISTGDEFVALAIFIAVGTIGVAAPLAIYFALGTRSKDVLDGINRFLAANNAVIMAVLILLIGVKLIGDGISGL
jgi:threonine/homoserine/homoserine lactone efflux protein